MTAWKEIVEKAFPENKGVMRGKPDVLTHTATPNAAITAGKVGTLCWDINNGNAYIKTANPSTWIVINA